MPIFMQIPVAAASLQALRKYFGRVEPVGNRAMFEAVAAGDLNGDGIPDLIWASTRVWTPLDERAVRVRNILNFPEHRNNLVSQGFQYFLGCPAPAVVAPDTIPRAANSDSILLWDRAGGKFSIADSASPRPQGCVGFDRTFFDSTASIELRLPFSR